MMKLGIYINAQHPQEDDPGRRFAETIEQVRLIRSLGFDSIWSGEHHVTDGFHYFPLLSMLMRLSAEAEGLTIGTNIVLLPLHNPIEMAEIAAFMDVITGGKFMLGVGLGYRTEEFAMYGVSIKERVSRLTESIGLMRRLWSEDKVTHRGRHWQFENVTIRPQPVKQTLPILIASQVPAGIERAAKIGDGWAVVPVPRVDQIAKEATLFRETRAAAGLPPSPHVTRIFEVSCAADEEKALVRAAPFLLTKYKAYASWGLPGIQFRDGLSDVEQLRGLAKDRFGVGTPEQVADALVAQHAAGITHATMRTSWPGMKHDEILAGIEMLGKKVLPAVRARTKAA